MLLFLNAESKSLNSNIDSSFGRCNFFLLYETEDDSYEFIPNDKQDLQTSVGAAVAESAIELEADAVIAVNPGPRAFKVLKEAGVKVYHTTAEKKLIEVLQAFGQDKLVPLESYLPYQS